MPNIQEGLSTLNVSAPPTKYSYNPSCNSTTPAKQYNGTVQTISLTAVANGYLLAGINFLIPDDSEQNVTRTTDGVLNDPQIPKLMYESPNISMSLENMA